MHFVNGDAANIFLYGLLNDKYINMIIEIRNTPRTVKRLLMGRSFLKFHYYYKKNNDVGHKFSKTMLTATFDSNFLN